MTPSIAPPRRRFCAALLGLALGWFVALAATAYAADVAAQERVLGVGGEQRVYLLHVPPGVSRPTALVLVFHGGGGNAGAIMSRTGINDIADREHFIVAYPQGEGRGFGRGGTWNIGTAESPSQADDVDFARAVVKDVERGYSIDPRRVYAAGISVGGAFAYRLACEMSDTFAAVAAVAATMVQPNCAPHSPVAVLHIHGTADEHIPLNGGEGRRTAIGREWAPPMRGIAFWAHADGCGSGQHATSEGRDTKCHAYDSCKAAVEYCLVAGGGHAWPGSEPNRRQLREQVYVSQDFPASQRIWAFFAAHPKP